MPGDLKVGLRLTADASGLVGAVKVSNPRAQHLQWDGLVIHADDPWWNTHYPPNDWGCKCFVETLSQGELEKLGKEGPDKAPAIITDQVTVGARGPSQRTVSVPRGIGAGWAYAPGRSVVANAQRHRIDHIQSRARAIEADLQRRKGEQRMIAQALSEGFQSEKFSRFLATTKAADPNEWAVAILPSRRLNDIGFEGGPASALRLSSGSVYAHRKRYQDFKASDWERVQRIVDEGELIRRATDKKNHRFLWLNDPVKGGPAPWVVVIKQTDKGEVYLLSYRRAGKKEIRKRKRS